MREDVLLLTSSLATVNAWQECSETGQVVCGHTNLKGWTEASRNNWSIPNNPWVLFFLWFKHTEVQPGSPLLCPFLNSNTIHCSGVLALFKGHAPAVFSISSDPVMLKERCSSCAPHLLMAVCNIATHIHTLTYTHFWHAYAVKQTCLTFD